MLERPSTLDRERFERVWARCIGTDAAAVFAVLDAQYREPHRRYHNPAHIRHCLHCFDLAADQMDDPDAVEMALWFHDAVYDIPENENERRSAELFIEKAGGRGLAQFRSKVHDLIMITMHNKMPATCDEKFIVDIDLSSFGLPWEEFLRDSIAVRNEHPLRPDAEFYLKQKKFLQSFARRRVICFTEFFRNRHGDRFRENIARYIARLEIQPQPSMDCDEA